MRFAEPTLPEIRLVKGEYFTKLDVACPSCGARPGQHCRTFRLSPGKHSTPLACAVSWHATRRASWSRWIERLNKQKCLRRVPLPEWVPWWAGEFVSNSRPREGFIILKAVRKAA